MLELIVRETKEIQSVGRSVKIITEERICSFKGHCTFERATSKMRDIFFQCILVSACVKAGILGE
ncbi:MAG: hypothetical protein E4H47_01685 [Parcubacteria group bacterium]|nr:MAG: hypothetical protein E4H47_01685 [Parcubacteria group bacterium]